MINIFKDFDACSWVMAAIAICGVAGIGWLIWLALQPDEEDPTFDDRQLALAARAGLTDENIDMAEGIGLGFLRYTTKKYRAKQNTTSPMLNYNGDRHLVTFGPTGSGKNTTSQTPVLLTHKASALVIDVKGQLCAITARERIEKGQEVAVINPFGVLDIPSRSYNPLAHLDPSAAAFASDCRRIAEGLVEVKEGSHWEKSALDVVELLVMWVVLYEEQKDLPRLLELLNLDKQARIELFSRMAASDNPVLSVGGGRYTSDSKEVEDCIQTAIVQLAFLRNPEVADVLQEKDRAAALSFADLKRKKMTVYLIIPPHLLHTHGKLLRLFVLSALGELIKEKTQPEKPVLFLLDEFAQLGHMGLIENAAAIVRDYKIRLWLILQNLPQLKDLYGQRWESFLSSAGVVQVFTPNDLATAEYFSKRSGIIKREHVTTTTNANDKKSTSVSEHDEPLFKYTELLGMRNDEEMLFCAGISQAILGCRIPYYEINEWEGYYDPDPYRMTTEELAAFEERAKSGQWVVK